MHADFLGIRAEPRRTVIASNRFGNQSLQSPTDFLPVPHRLPGMLGEDRLNPFVPRLQALST